MSQQPNHLVALDVGNSMTRVAIAEAPAGGRPSDWDASRLRLLGFGDTETQGWHKGNLADIGQSAASIRKAVEQAEAAAGVAIESAVVGIGGPHLGGIASRAVIELGQRPREVRREDVERVLDDARNIPLSAGREVLHMVPKEFVLDSQEGIRDPVGMLGMHLEVRVHFITNSIATSQNLVTAANRAGVLVETVVGEAYAAGEAIATEEEHELGVLVAVIGGPSCEIVAYSQSGLSKTCAVAIGGDHFTGDISVGLRVPRSDAETIKRNFGSVFPGWSHDGSAFEAPAMGHQPSRVIPQNVLRQILQPRAQELFGLLLEEVRRTGGTRHWPGGIVLSGGGARLAGLCDLAESVLGIPARIGLPPRVQNLPEALDSPEYATLFSLLQYGARVRQHRAPRERAASSRLRDLLAWK
jgi:cell division protein FtsA